MVVVLLVVVGLVVVVVVGLVVVVAAVVVVAGLVVVVSEASVGGVSVKCEIAPSSDVFSSVSLSVTLQ